MSTIADELARRAKVIGGKAWGADKQKPRIYMNVGRKDVSAYFMFPDAKYETDSQEWDEFTGLGGSRFCVYIDDCGEKPEWYTAQKSLVRERFRGKALALIALDREDEELAKQFAEAETIEEEVFEKLHRLLSDGKLDEARSVFSSSGVF